MPFDLTPTLIDRAIGAVLGSAAGDALGAPYEFKPSLPDDVPVEFKAGGPWNLGEWTDDTSMAVPILQAIARGDALTDAATLGRIVAEWRDWAVDAKDVGIQTRQVLGLLPAAPAVPVDADADAAALDLAALEPAVRAAARTLHERTGRSGGNGSLMRTGPVALASLDDGQEVALAESARRISELTHYETDAGARRRPRGVGRDRRAAGEHRGRRVMGERRGRRGTRKTRGFVENCGESRMPVPPHR